MRRDPRARRPILAGPWRLVAIDEGRTFNTPYELRFYPPGSHKTGRIDKQGFVLVHRVLHMHVRWLRAWEGVANELGLPLEAWNVRCVRAAARRGWLRSRDLSVEERIEAVRREYRKEWATTPEWEETKKQGRAARWVAPRHPKWKRDKRFDVRQHFEAWFDTTAFQLRTPEPVDWWGVDDVHSTQSFCDKSVVSDYVARFRQGLVVPPIFIHEDGEIADGHHRWKAAKKAGVEEIPVVVMYYGTAP